MALVDQIRNAFRANMHEKDPSRIEEQKEAAVRGLGNFMFYEVGQRVRHSLLPPPSFLTAIHLPHGL
jgi:hypothetical protein